MPLTPAERSKRYREKKKHDLAYKEKNRERQKKNYVPVRVLGLRKLKQRRKTVASRVQKYRSKNCKEESAQVRI